ncbi:MAG TPA: hypothetical protein DHV63_18550, partial [Pseudomonas sp.]|nr:hypothetical protein [Pseudomonas sp.]
MSSADTRRALLVINRHARNGAGVIDNVLDTLRKGGIELVRPSDPDAPVGEQIAHGADGCDLVIVGGGDGTLNAAAPALIKAGLPVGILPLGTANDLAKTLGISTEPGRGGTADRLRRASSDGRRCGQRPSVPERREHRLQLG